MPYKCTCGYEDENGRKLAGHLGLKKSRGELGHEKVGWIDVDGQIYSVKGRKGKLISSTGPLVMDQTQPSSSGQLDQPDQPKPGQAAPPSAKSIASGRPAAANPLHALVGSVQFAKVEFLMTPQILRSYECAIRYGYDGQWQDWLSFISMDFWVLRGVDPFAKCSGFPATDEERQQAGNEQRLPVIMGAV